MLFAVNGDSQIGFGSVFHLNRASVTAHAEVRVCIGGFQNGHSIAILSCIQSIGEVHITITVHFCRSRGGSTDHKRAEPMRVGKGCDIPCHGCNILMTFVLNIDLVIGYTPAPRQGNANRHGLQIRQFLFGAFQNHSVCSFTLPRFTDYHDFISLLSRRCHHAIHGRDVQRKGLVGIIIRCRLDIQISLDIGCNVSLDRHTTIRSFQCLLGILFLFLRDRI